MTRSLLLRELVTMLRQKVLTAGEFCTCISQLNRGCHPRFVYRQVTSGSI